MIIYPNIEILDGQTVNLLTGVKEQPTVYKISPLEAARQFAAAGAQWLHVVDLNAAFGDQHNNSELVKQIIQTVDIPVQVTGGMRTFATINGWFESGAARVVLGTVAVTDRSLLMEAANRHPGGIVASLDTRGGFVMIDGWRNQTSFQLLDLVRELQLTGIAAIVHTDIDRFVGDASESLALTMELGSEVSIPVIASGTVANLDDIARLRFLPNINGAIVGRALFSNQFNLTEALEIARQRETNPNIDATEPSGTYTAHKPMRAYLAGYTLSQAGRWWNQELRNAVTHDNPYVEMCIPQEDLFDCIQTGQIEAGEIVKLYTQELNTSDCVVAVLDGIEQDAWTGYECGYAKARGKPIIGLKTDTSPNTAQELLLRLCDHVIWYSADADPQSSIAAISSQIGQELMATPAGA